MNKISTWYKMYQFYNSIKLSVKKGSGKMKKKKLQMDFHSKTLKLTQIAIVSYQLKSQQINSKQKIKKAHTIYTKAG